MNVIDLSDPATNVDYDSLIGINDGESQEIFENEVKEDEQQEEGEEASSKKDGLIVEPRRDVESLRRAIRDQLLFKVYRQSQLDSADARKVTSDEDDESRQQKLERIRQELEELRTEDSTPEMQTDIKELCQLQSKLATESSNRFASLRKELIEKYEGQDTVILPNINLDTTTIKRLQRLDQKMSEMESYVGNPEALEAEEDRKSVYSKVNELYRSIQLLQGDDKEKGKLQKFRDRLVDLNEEFENSLLGKKIQQDPRLKDETMSKVIKPENKINEINIMYSMFKEYQDLLPLLAERMKSLNKMNNRVVEVYETTKGLDSQITSIQEQEKLWLKALNELDKKFDEQEVKIRQNMEQIRRKIDTLEDKALQRDSK
ncbi:Jnm1p [Saccharomyces paradoxus]|uniref:Jnm1p n=1 Tax=Saccharomyces paradoxus TaxID=27291 RepID=A0A8B8UY07_SACPA|nr:Jnm1 [Saccharomyces paradoxus]QHS75564.1 Jnm1 [Saccharomyces paradoxus]